MKHLVFLFFLFAVMPVAGFAQNHEAVVLEEHTVGIVDSLGHPTVVIRGWSDKRAGASISVAGFDIEFGARNHPDPLQWKGDKKCHRNMRPRVDMFNSFQLGFNILTSPDYSRYAQSEGDFLALYNGKYIQFSFHLVGLEIPLVRYSHRSHLSVVTHLGLKWNNYVFSNDITLGKTNGMIHPVPIDGSFKKSKLTTFALTVPVELQYRSKSRFFASIGGWADLTLREFTKYNRPKNKYIGDCGVNFVQFGAIAKVGYSVFYLFGSYGFTPLFDRGEAPRTNPVTVGFGFFM
jgi:hypothetical protein